MKNTLNKLFEHQTLSEQDAYSVLTRIGKGDFNHSQIAAFLTVYLMRNISVEELTGFRNALLDLCLKVDLSDFNTIDVCGTGGDGKDTFNISTLSAFVIAGAGYKVAKHGNYGVSSSCGSSNVLEHLGYEFTNNESILKSQLDNANFCMMHAPLFHPAMKNVGPIRKELGIKTFFNMLGPLVNPSNPQNQLVGVFNLEIARIYNYLLQSSDKKYTILHSLDGYDEISLTGNFKAISNNGETLLSPENIGFKTQKQEDIFGGETIKDAAKIFINVLNNECTQEQKNAVLANSSFAIQCFEPNKTLPECTSIAQESIDSGGALKCLKGIMN
ncbi:MAG: anthranilate phosphoribosyltransferase [Flavobacteriales bacterium]|nr:MAG: anthranilate phosphoribosyltransferase [Flavobacteriales bacterium]